MFCNAEKQTIHSDCSNLIFFLNANLVLYGIISINQSQSFLHINDLWSSDDKLNILRQGKNVNGRYFKIHIVMKIFVQVLELVTTLSDPCRQCNWICCKEAVLTLKRAFLTHPNLSPCCSLVDHNQYFN